jgi:hypothetical protein
MVYFCIRQREIKKFSGERQVEVQYAPTEEVVLKLLEMFVVDFMQNGKLKSYV